MTYWLESGQHKYRLLRGNGYQYHFAASRPTMIPWRLYIVMGSEDSFVIGFHLHIVPAKEPRRDESCGLVCEALAM